jgi:hypothetical protein
MKFPFILRPAEVEAMGEAGVKSNPFAWVARGRGVLWDLRAGDSRSPRPFIEVLGGVRGFDIPPLWSRNALDPRSGGVRQAGILVPREPEERTSSGLGELGGAGDEERQGLTEDGGGPAAPEGHSLPVAKVHQRARSAFQGWLWCDSPKLTRIFNILHGDLKQV